MSTHTVVWSHDECDHDESDPDDYCSPSGDIICTADEHANPMAECRRFCNACEYVTICTDPNCEHEVTSLDRIIDPTGAHCDNGHPSTWHSWCNWREWLTDEGLSDLGPDLPPGERHRDAPIVVEWVGGAYVWDYAPEVTA